MAIFDVHVCTVCNTQCSLIFVSCFYREVNLVDTLSKTQINFTDGRVVVSEPTNFLSSAVLVTGAILISQGDCFIQKDISMNVSIVQEISASE